MKLSNFNQLLFKIYKRYDKFKIIDLILSKLFFFNLKYSNFFINNFESNKKKDHLRSYPFNVFLNTTNLCNYRCKFCEIHYFYDFAKKTAGKIFPNNLKVDYIEKFSKLFERSQNIELSGATGEPLINPNIINICKKLKEMKNNLSLTTNASLLDKNLADQFVNIKFDIIMASVHSGEEKNYASLQGGDFNKVIGNLEKLIKIRNLKGSNKPKIIVNCLIFKLNQNTIKKLLKILKSINIDVVNINQYYASRNLIDDKASFYFFPEEGNKFLEDIYEYAKLININISPYPPNYINLEVNGSNVCNSNYCVNPWTDIKLKGAVEYENSHYIGICNRIMLFRLNFKEFEGDFNKDIWNHELIRYFRKVINNNPICQFCKDPDTPRLRCLNNKEYMKKRDLAIRSFFTNAYKKIKIIERKGIYLLNENPYKLTE